MKVSLLTQAFNTKWSPFNSSSIGKEFKNCYVSCGKVMDDVVMKTVRRNDGRIFKSLFTREAGQIKRIGDVKAGTTNGFGGVLWDNGVHGCTWDCPF